MDWEERARGLEILLDEYKVFYYLVNGAEEAIGVMNMEGVLSYINPASASLWGYDDLEEMLGLEWKELIPDPPAPIEEWLPQAARDGWRGELLLRRTDGSSCPVLVTLFGIYEESGDASALAFIARDISEHKAMERELRARAAALEEQQLKLQKAYEEQARLREEMIAAQQQVIQELSAPLIPVAEGILVMPLVGSISPERAGRIKDALLLGIEEQRAEVAIMDITGVTSIDVETAQMLLEMAYSAQLLGAKVVLTGIRPEVAQALVELGVDLSPLETRADLQEGIEYGMRTRMRGG